jgi:ceramide glucosyltransferase
MMILLFLLMLTVASWAYWAVAALMTWRFFTRKPEPDPNFRPPVSILKPVRGLDYQAYLNFLTFCQQDYPEFEILFGVDDPNDPAVPIIQRLQREFPDLSIRLIVAPPLGTNRKASILDALAAQARYDILVISDSDVRVRPDYLRRVVAPLHDPSVGLVTCPYRGILPMTLTARLELLYMVTTFLPSVMVARRVLNMRFALGATNAIRRADLERLGGFASFADYLADDFQLGLRVARMGLRVHLSDYVAEISIGATTFEEQWDREIRWIHCTRVSRPTEYTGLLLCFSTPLAVLVWIVSGFSTLGWLVLGASLALRWAVAWVVSVSIEDLSVHRHLIWLPMRDMLTALIWLAGLIGRRVSWRGEWFVLDSEGRLKPAPQNASVLERWLRL